MVKICSKCKIEKDVSEFYKGKNTKDGYQSQCKSCRSAWQKAYRQTDVGKAKKKEDSKKERQTERSKKYQREYRQNNKDTAAAYMAEYAHSERGRVVLQAYLKTSAGRSSLARYRRSPKGREAAARANSKRRGLGFIKLFLSYFDESVPTDWHHVDNEHVVALPSKIHESLSGFGREKHREKCLYWVKWIYPDYTPTNTN